MINTSKTIDELSIEQKAHLVSGKNFWQINGIEKYNLSPIIVSDGPHGLRRAVNVTELNGNSKTIKAICFPTASAQACSFDEDLLLRLGEILGEECQAENVQVLLGPANNIKRTPLCGRNFEYYSEDPYLAGKLSSALIKGVQSKGIGTSLKHFVANNQEKSRMTIDAVIDERTLREIYLTAFEIPITESKPWTIMASYNRVNGSYVCQNEYLLKDILRNEWGYQGLVMSDWGAVDQLADSITSGLDLEMPTSGEVGPSKLIKAFKKKKLSLESINESTRHVIELIQKGNSNKKSNDPYNLEKHHELAREIGRECIVLLKNDQQILPVTKEKYKRITIVGDFAIHPRFQGGGSSHIYPYKINTLLEEFQNRSNEFEIQFARGYDANIDDIDQGLLNEAKEKSTNADVVLLCIGLPDRYETEGVDRKHHNIPPNQLQLVGEISSKNENIVIILSIGSSVKLPFKNHVKGILCNWLLGEAGAGATFDVITGLFNPCGKLAESFILNEHDDPSFGNYPGIDDVEYKEGVLVGYRFHDYYKKELAYEFGYGLSYTTFEYSDLQLSKVSIQENEELIVTLKVKNSGLAGKEIIQLYISEKEQCVNRRPMVLNAFKKIFLKVGVEKSVQFILNKRSFAYYNVKTRGWEVKSGTFTILIGKSSRNIVLNKDIIVTSSSAEKNLPGDEKVFRKRIYLKKSKKITRNTKMEKLKHHVIGNSVYKAMDKEMRKSLEGDNLIDDEKALDDSSMKEFLNNIPLRALVNLSQGKGLSEKRMNQLIFILNRTRTDTFLGKFIGIFKKVKE